MDITTDIALPDIGRGGAGYLSGEYARSLTMVGKAIYLPESGAWMLERPVPGNGQKDLCGTYPLFCCKDWANIERDIFDMEEKYISLSFVTDPFGAYKETDLKRIFSDVCYPYKTHYIIELDKYRTQEIDKNHLRNLRKAERKVTVCRESDPTACLDEWNRLYALLIQRHGINGVARFSSDSFQRQLKVPGLRIYSARYHGQIVGMVLFYIMEDIVYYHLGAYDETGYAHQASFTVFNRAIEDFTAQGLMFLDLGSGAGLKDNPSDGLARFKRGWSNATRTAWFCGRILNKKAYAHLLQQRNDGGGFFPAYRENL